MRLKCIYVLESYVRNVIVHVFFSCTIVSCCTGWLVELGINGPLTAKVIWRRALYCVALLDPLHGICIQSDLSLFLRKVRIEGPEIDATRIVRESDYSPASQLFCRVKKTMTGNYHKLDLVNIDAHTKFGWIMSIRSQDIERKQNSDLNKGP